ncbi:hypothetical protein J2R76_004059 [Bradyrhizobium sp. USDA 4532]|uniref:type IV toxin-antitoxin system AbiEi family antitoxin domain-containing protein n=1 Tax=unclassified Bradyrhizobium TaxID=2631580 RepID=UPI002811D1AA|nr:MULTISPECIES: transcriptional regulator [unclassified Bradyrhizobium]MCP1835719.1 hypothetical protein [Bradyrhizobium sp. USDA 4545]MCP1920468.1 hypothetical protein [Bradyrhizobium sp. USDA 4532]
MKQKGLVVQLGRGLYQLPDAPIDTHHSLAEAAKRVPKGVVALTSAFSFHDLTDTIPSMVWIAIGPKDRQPLPANPPMQFVRFSPERLLEGVETHIIEGCPVKIFSPAKTVVDLFRYRRSAGTRYRHSTGLNLALEGLREALRTRKAKPSEIAGFCAQGRGLESNATLHRGDDSQWLTNPKMSAPRSVHGCLRSPRNAISTSIFSSPAT